MNDFRLGSVPSSSALYVYSLRDTIWSDPPYQRSGDVWPLEKRQLLIDSIINGYDIPKLYFHEFFPAREEGGKKYRYAIVDGKQRLQSIFEFIEGRFPLGPSVEYLQDPSVQLSNLTYAELAKEYPDIKTRFDGCVLPIVTIQTSDIELIEDMFSRLNEAVPLNAAEKRNAFGGPIPPLVRAMAKHSFFTTKLPFTNRRYRHFDLATKFLFFEHRSALGDTRKSYLDEFVRTWHDAQGAKELHDAAVDTMDSLSAVFIDADPLLRSVGMVVLYYFLGRDARNNNWANKLARTKMLEFEAARSDNRNLAENDVSKASYELLEFDRLAQSINDGVALEYRYNVLRKYVGPAKKPVGSTNAKKA